MKLKAVISIALLVGILAGLACMLFVNFGIGLIIWISSSLGGVVLLHELRRMEERKAAQQRAQEEPEGDEQQ